MFLFHIYAEKKKKSKGKLRGNYAPAVSCVLCVPFPATFALALEPLFAGLLDFHASGGNSSSSINYYTRRTQTKATLQYGTY